MRSTDKSIYMKALMNVLSETVDIHVQYCIKYKRMSQPDLMVIQQLMEKINQLDIKTDFKIIII